MLAEDGCALQRRARQAAAFQRLDFFTRHQRSYAMVNQQTLQGNWNEIKGKLRNKWGQLTNDDLQSAQGNIDQLVGLIQRKTGEARNSIEKFLEDATASGGS